MAFKVLLTIYEHDRPLSPETRWSAFWYDPLGDRNIGGQGATREAAAKDCMANIRKKSWTVSQENAFFDLETGCEVDPPPQDEAPGTTAWALLLKDDPPPV